jgi:hypothetical protein
MPDLLKEVFLVCDCEHNCRKDQHKIEAKIKGPGARCSVWISRGHLSVVAGQTMRRIAAERVHADGLPENAGEGEV